MDNISETMHKTIDRVNEILKDDHKPIKIEKITVLSFSDSKYNPSLRHVLLISKNLKFENATKFREFRKKIRQRMDDENIYTNPRVARGPTDRKYGKGKYVFAMNRLGKYFAGDDELMVYFRGNKEGLDYNSNKMNSSKMFDYSKPITVVAMVTDTVNLMSKLVDVMTVFEKAFLLCSDFDAPKNVIMSNYFDWIAKRRIGDIAWDDIGGMQKSKDTLEKLTVLMDDTESFNNDERDHVLLVGPPGVGKTLLIKAVLSRVYGKVNILPYLEVAKFINVLGEDSATDFVAYILNFINNLTTYTNRWTYLFIDEVDSIAKEDTQAKALLREMDNVGKRRFSILATTNRPDVMDFALFRPGRFYPIVVVDLPDADDRVDIWNIGNRLHKLKLSDTDVNNFAAVTKHFTGADIIHICKMANREQRFADIYTEKFKDFTSANDFIATYIRKNKDEITKKNRSWKERVKVFVKDSEATVMYV